MSVKFVEKEVEKQVREGKEVVTKLVPVLFVQIERAPVHDAAGVPTKIEVEAEPSHIKRFPGAHRAFLAEKEAKEKPVKEKKAKKDVESK